MKKVIVLNLAIVIVGLVFLFNSFSSKGTPPAEEMPENNESQKKKYETKTDNQGAVVIEVTPIALSSKENAAFNVTFTTHSVELAYDIVKIAKLTDDKGNAYNATGWTGGSGGHHLSGILTFPPMPSGIHSLTLTIPQVDTFDREFRWNVELKKHFKTID